MEKRLFCVTGASGTGKTTLLNYVQAHFNIKVTEVSARPFLPKNTDYVNSLDLFSQVLITQNRFVSFIEQAILSEDTLFSRSPIDSLAYERVLGKAPFIDKLLQRQIDVTKPLIQYLYVPIEFPMESKDDTVRGTNSDIQIKTDWEIRKAMTVHGIRPIVISGSVDERCRQLDEVLKAYKRG